MDDAKLFCPKCSGTMQRGFILDSSYGAHLVAHWHAGTPKKALLEGAVRPATQ